MMPAASAVVTHLLHVCTVLSVWRDRADDTRELIRQLVLSQHKLHHVGTCLLHRMA